MRLSCPECKENLSVLSRPSKSQAISQGQVLNVVYCICTSCGEKSRAEIFISSKKHNKRYGKKFKKENLTNE